MRDLSAQRFHPWRLLAQAARGAEDLQRVATLLPEVLKESLESIHRGGLTVRFDLQHFERLVQQLVRVGNTLAAGIVVAGLIVGSSLIVRAGVGPVSLGFVGYALASVLGLWLLWSMLRKP